MCFTLFPCRCRRLIRSEQQCGFWKTEYIAVTENQNEAALLAAYDLEECIESKSYSICFWSFPMEKSKDSCLATLLFNDSLSALEVCRIRNVQLPLKDPWVMVGG